MCRVHQPTHHRGPRLLFDAAQPSLSMGFNYTYDILRTKHLNHAFETAAVANKKGFL